MNEPKRWLDGAAPAGARALLQAGIAEGPSRRSLQRTLAAVGTTTAAATSVGGALAAAQTTAQTLGSSALVFAAKCTGIGVVSATLMVGSALGIQHYRAKPAQRSVAMTPTQAHASARANKHASENEHARSTEVAAAPLSVGESAEKSDSATPPGTLQARPESAAMRVGSTVAPPLPTTRLMAASGKSAPSVGVTAAARAKPQGNVSPAPASQPERALADEMEVIDAARVRLRSGDPSGAVQRLDAYARHSDFVRFAPEALYIRMEAQLQLGNRAAAASAARSMTQRFPHAAQAGRAAEILDSLGER